MQPKIDQLNLAQLDKLKGMPKDPHPKDKDWVARCKIARAKWRDYTSGNPYILVIKNRTMDHTFRRQAYGKNIFQAVRRYYRGLDNNSNWTWQCTKVVAVYQCTDTRTAISGKLIYGKD